MRCAAACCKTPTKPIPPPRTSFSKPIKRYCGKKSAARTERSWTIPTRWLSKIAVNTCLDRLRSKKWQIWRRRPAPEDEATILSMTASRAPESEDRYFAGQINGRLTAALARLSDRQRVVFTLRHYEEMSLEEIGQILGLDVGTVKAHMFRAVNKLRVDLRDLYEGRHHERARTFK